MFGRTNKTATASSRFLFAKTKRYVSRLAGASSAIFIIEKLQSNVSSKVVTAATTTTTTRTAVSTATNKLLLSSSSSKTTSSTLGATSRTFTTASSSSSKGFVQWYEGHLHARPVVTKMVTGTFLWGLGDCVAQVVPQMAFQKQDDDENDQKQKQPFIYDSIRTLRACTFGCIFHAPLSHVHYNFLEWMTVRGGFTGLSIPFFKAFMEQFVYWSWFSNSLYHGCMQILTSMEINPTAIYNRIADVLWETQKAQWVFWIPVQLLNFQYVPVRHQLNVVLLTSVVWTALLSAWYPPQQPDQQPMIEKDDGNKKKAQEEVDKK